MRDEGISYLTHKHTHGKQVEQPEMSSQECLQYAVVKEEVLDLATREITPSNFKKTMTLLTKKSNLNLYRRFQWNVRGPHILSSCFWAFRHMKFLTCCLVLFLIPCSLEFILLVRSLWVRLWHRRWSNGSISSPISSLCRNAVFSTGFCTRNTPFDIPFTGIQQRED